MSSRYMVWLDVCLKGLNSSLRVTVKGDLSVMSHWLLNVCMDDYERDEDKWIIWAPDSEWNNPWWHDYLQMSPVSIK